MCLVSACGWVWDHRWPTDDDAPALIASAAAGMTGCRAPIRGRGGRSQARSAGISRGRGGRGGRGGTTSQPVVVNRRVMFHGAASSSQNVVNSAPNATQVSKRAQTTFEDMC